MPESFSLVLTPYLQQTSYSLEEERGGRTFLNGFQYFTKTGIPIEIWSLMAPGIGCSIQTAPPGTPGQIFAYPLRAGPLVT